MVSIFSKDETIQLPAPYPLSVSCSAPLSLLMTVYSVCVPSLVFVVSSFPGCVLKHINLLTTVVYKNGRSRGSLAKEDKSHAQRHTSYVFSHL